MQYLTKVIICGALGFVMLFSSGCSNNQQKENEYRIEIEKEKAVVVALAPSLAEIYRKNELKAKEAFENKIVVVLGKVSSVGVFSDRPDLLYIDMGEFYNYNICGQFRDVHRKDLQKLNPGDVVVIQGECFVNKQNSIIYIDGAKIISDPRTLDTSLPFY